MLEQSSVPARWPLASVFPLAPSVRRSVYGLPGSLWPEQQMTGRCAKSLIHGDAVVESMTTTPLLADLNPPIPPTFIPSFTPPVRLPLAALCPSRQPSGYHHSFFQSDFSFSQAECVSDRQAMVEDKKMRKFLGVSIYKYIIVSFSLGNRILKT